MRNPDSTLSDFSITWLQAQDKAQSARPFERMEMHPETWRKIKRSIARSTGQKFKPTAKEKALRTLLLEMAACRRGIVAFRNQNGDKESPDGIAQLTQLAMQATRVFDSMPIQCKRRCPMYLIRAIGRVEQFPGNPEQEDVFDLALTGFWTEEGRYHFVIGDTVYAKGLPFSINCKLVAAIPPEQIPSQVRAVGNYLGRDVHGEDPAGQSGGEMS